MEKDSIMSATDLESATASLISSVDIISDVINEGATKEVVTPSGDIPSLRKALADNLYFQDPVPWSQGDNETNFNQLRTFTDGSVWWSPSATNINPVPMGASPEGDTNWYPFQDTNLVNRLKAELIGRNFKGTFLSGFTYEDSLDVGADSDNNLWQYNGTLPFTVVGGTSPSEPTYTQLEENDHQALVNRDAQNAHPATSIDWSALNRSAEMIATSSHRYNVWRYMTSEMREDAMLENPVLDHSPAFQQAVNEAIASGVKTIFIPTSDRQRYNLQQTVTIESSGFQLLGDAFPQYNINGYCGERCGNFGVDSEGAGHVFSETITTLFDYGNNRADITSNQFVARNVNFYSKNKAITKYAIRFSQNNNGPHRGLLISQCSAGGFDAVLFFDTIPPNVAAATVTLENCSFRGNTYTARAPDLIFGFRMTGCQSEQGARVDGVLDAGVSLLDNIYEGQVNPISINGKTSQVLIENNYFEFNGGEYHVEAISTTLDASITIAPNYIVFPVSKDIYRMTGPWFINEEFRHRQSGDSIKTRRCSMTAYDLGIAPNSNVFGQFYAALLAEGKGLPLKCDGFCNPNFLTTGLPDVHRQDLGLYDAGISKTAINYTGLSQSFLRLDRSYNANDFIVVTALVKVNNGDGTGRPLFRVLNEAGNNVMLTASTFEYKDEYDEYQVFIRAGYVSESGNFMNLIFGPDGTNLNPTNGSEISVIAIGASKGFPETFFDQNDDPITTRQYFEVCNPFLEGQPLTYSATESVPAIADGSFYTFVIPAALAVLGDNVTTSCSVDLQGLELHTWVSANGSVRVRILNRTGASITLGNATFKTSVVK